MDSVNPQPFFTSTPFIVTLIVFVVTCIVFFFLRRKSSKRGVLLMGLCDSGKTLIFSQLVHQKYVSTQTSMKENLGDYTIKNGTLRLIDIPGHERLRDRFFEQYKSIGRGLIYIIDSVTLQKDIRDAAEFLYNILSDSITMNNLSILVVCNKQDLPLAKTSTIIKSMLEKELNAVRVTKSSQLESVDPKGQATRFVGRKGVDFSFEHLPVKVEFVEASVSSNHKNTTDIEKWLAKLSS